MSSSIFQRIFQKIPQIEGLSSHDRRERFLTETRDQIMRDIALIEQIIPLIPNDFLGVDVAPQKETILAGDDLSFINKETVSLIRRKETLENLLKARLMILEKQGGSQKKFRQDAIYSQLERSIESVEEKLADQEDAERISRFLFWRDLLIKRQESVAKIHTSIDGIRSFERHTHIRISPDDVLHYQKNALSVIFTLKKEAFERISHSKFDRGLFFDKTPFILLKELPQEKSKSIDATKLHEYGHILIENAPCHGDQFHFFHITALLIQLTQIKNLDKRLEDVFCKKLLRELKTVINFTHNEFIAELNVAIKLPEDVLRKKHWTTAEDLMKQFCEELSSWSHNEQLPSIIRDILSSWVQGNKFSQFIKEKNSVIDAIALARSYDNPQALHFVLAAAIVLPVKSYHHIPKLLKQKYHPK